MKKLFALFSHLLVVLAFFTSLFPATASTDYGPAIWRPAYSGHWYTSGYGKKFYVIHDIEGSYWSCISYFQQAATQASVHYVANGKKDNTSDSAPGEITQMVRDSYYAWHALCWNQHSMGTEHEGYASNPAWYTPEMYDASAALTKAKCEKYGIAKDRNHIVGHDQKRIAGWPAYASANLGIDPYCNDHVDPGLYWDWSGFMARINATPSTENPHINPAIIRNTDGRQELFAVGTTGEMYHLYQTSPNAGWSAWLSLGGSWAQNVVPAAGRNSDGRLEIFVIGNDGQMYHAYQQTASNSSSWWGWASMGGAFSKTATVAVGYNQDGRMEVFAIGTSGDLKHNYQNGPGTWSGWTSLGGQWAQNSCVRTGNNLDGRQEVFIIGNTKEMYHIWQTSPNAGWSGWASLGGSWDQAGRFAVGRNSDGRMEVFAIAAGGDLQHAYQTAANGGWWGWASLGGTWNQAAQPVTALSADGKVEVFVIGQTGNFYQQYQTSGGNWSGWLNLGGTFTQDIRPCVGVNQNGTLELFTTGQATDMVHAYQNSAVSTSSWTGWPSLGGSWN